MCRMCALVNCPIANSWYLAAVSLEARRVRSDNSSATHPVSKAEAASCRIYPRNGVGSHATNAFAFLGAPRNAGGSRRHGGALPALQGPANGWLFFHFFQQARGFLGV